MINYSTCMRGNPTDKDAAKKAYANAQYSQVMTLDKFCYHIASHGCVYSRADIQAILILAVDCLREQLLNGQQIQMGDLGVFSNSIRSLGAHSMAEFTVEPRRQTAAGLFSPYLNPGDSIAMNTAPWSGHPQRVRQS